MDYFVPEPDTDSGGPASVLADALDLEPVELCLVVPAWQLTALDELARIRGQNVGQLLRHVIAKLVECPAARS